MSILLRHRPGWRSVDEQYRWISEVVSDGMIVVNPLTENIVAANTVACRLLGYAGEELLGRPLLAFIESDYQRLLSTYLRSVEPDGSFEMQVLLRCKDGLSLPAEMRGVSISYTEHPHHLLAVRDLSATVRAEEQMWENEAEYRGLFAATGEGLLIIDLRAGVVEANPAACRLLGCSRDDLIGRPLTAVVDPSANRSLDDWLRTVGEGGTAQAQLPGRRQDGQAFDMELQGSSVTYKGRRHILAVMRDITERVRAYDLLEQRVAERTRELYTLLDVSHHVASTLDLQPLLELILDQLKVVADYTGASLALLEDETAVLIATRGPNPEEHILRRRFPMERGRSIWSSIRNGNSIIIDDVRGATALAAAYRDMVGELLETTFVYIRSWLAVPLVLKERVIGLLALSHGEPGFFTSRHATLAGAIAAQAAVAIENARLYEQAQQVAILEERQRLARELHDSVSQALYGIALGARTARLLLDRDAGQVAQPLDYVLSLAETGLAEMRALIFELLPAVLEKEGLVAALQRQAAAVQARYGITVELALDEEPAAPLAVKEALYRIAQEALHNTVKHAQARTTRVLLNAAESALTLEVQDDGIGFDPATSFPGHLGQSTMRERAMRLGGSFEVTSAPGLGTRIEARIPI